MNKLLIVLLAACLVSVQAFVRREAPTNNPIDVNKLAQDARNAVDQLLEQLKLGIDANKGKIDDFVKQLPDFQPQLEEVKKILTLQPTPAPEGSKN